MNPLKEAETLLAERLVGKAIKIPGLRKPRVVLSVNIGAQMYGEDECEAVVWVNYADGNYAFSPDDIVEVVS